MKERTSTLKIGIAAVNAKPVCFCIAPGGVIPLYYTLHIGSLKYLTFKTIDGPCYILFSLYEYGIQWQEIFS